MPYYDEPDDDREPEPVELVTAKCPICGKAVTFPEDTAIDEDHFCSLTCYHVWAAERAAEYARVEEEMWRQEMATMREASCVRCRKAFTDHPGSLDWCHDFQCESDHVSRLYNLPPSDPDSPIPF